MNWTPDALTELATRYWHSATLMAAVELGVFDALDTPETLEQLARQTGAAAPLLRSLLDALCGLQLLEKSGDLYALAQSVQPLLSRSSPSCMLDALRYNCDLFKQWQQLASVVRTGEPASAQSNQLGGDAALTRRFVRGMEAKARAFAPLLAPQIDLTEARDFMDVGSGPGTLSRLLAERYPRVAVTLLDLPEVMALAQPMWAESAALDRVRFVAADYRRDPLPGGFDTILYAGALHQETLASAQALLAKFHQSLRPGGRVYIVDLMVDADRTTPVLSCLFQLSMMLSAPTAHVFSDAEVRSLLTQCGFELRPTSQPTGSPYRIIAANRV